MGWWPVKICVILNVVVMLGYASMYCASLQSILGVGVDSISLMVSQSLTS